MSGRMSVERARRLADGGVHTVHSGLVIPAARTIVDQAEQIERLQEAVVRVARMSGWPDHAYRTVLALHPGDLGEEQP